MFLHKFMKEKKSAFLIIEENTDGIISTNPHLNQRYVRDEVFNNQNLKALGFSIQDESLNSTHSEEESNQVLFDISEKIQDKLITTRNSRGKVVEVLEPSTQKLIDQNKDKNPHPITLRSSNSGNKLEINHEKSGSNKPKPEDEKLGSNEPKR